MRWLDESTQIAIRGGDLGETSELGLQMMSLSRGDQRGLISSHSGLKNSAPNDGRLEGVTNSEGPTGRKTVK